MTLAIAQLGQPVLRRRADEIALASIGTTEFQQLVTDMLDTLKTSQGAGLAGPQVFRSQRIFLAAVEPPFRADQTPALEVVINPILTPLTTEQDSAWEGCLSFAELLVLVPRYQAVRLEFLDRAGERKSLDLAGFAARVVQHEYDHLEGILTVDRAVSPRHIVKASEIEAVLAEEERLGRLFSM
jgi:peptide deformylase